MIRYGYFILFLAASNLLNVQNSFAQQASPAAAPVTANMGGSKTLPAGAPVPVKPAVNANHRGANPPAVGGPTKNAGTISGKTFRVKP